MEFFDEPFIKALPDDPKIALYEICSKYINSIGEASFKFKHHLEAYAFAEAFIKANELDINVPDLTASNRAQRQNVIQNFLSIQRNQLHQYVESDEEERMLQRFRGEFSAHIGKSFSYEFSEGDLQRVQVLINELRSLVSSSELFEDKHKRRLLNRIERLQGELHKKQSDLDHYWGLVGDAGVALGKFGTDAKPFVDRIKEVTNIVWRTQSRAEELPSDSKPALLSSEPE